MNTKQIEAIATECADAHIDAGTPSFWMTEQLPAPDSLAAGDYDHLADELGRKPTDEEVDAFEDTYADRMEYHRDGWGRVRRLKAVRDALEMDQATFAEWVGVSVQQRVSEWERGVRYPASEKVELAELKSTAQL